MRLPAAASGAVAPLAAALACAATADAATPAAGVMSAAAPSAGAPVPAAATPARPVAYPSPGTTTANPRTQISFRGVAPRAIGAVRVTGSRSGTHSGTLKPHSDGRGASFVPARPFRAGERVRVSSRAVTYAFSIGRRPPPAKLPPTEAPDVGRGAVQRFVTRPDLVPPALTVTTSTPGTAPGLVFVAPKAGRGQDGPMIVDDNGHIVWFKPIAGGELATDFRVQTYQGEPVLTWWQGRLSGGHGQGEGVIYDTRYRPVRRVRAGNGYHADEHELVITPQNTALVIAYDPVERDLSSVHGRGRVVDAVIQEIDIPTGLVLFEWHSLGNIGFDESHRPVPEHGGTWDYVHPNSVALDADGDFVLSARLTSAVYKIDRATGRIVWRLGGTKSDFKFGPGARFDYQHDARPQPDGTLTLFDNSRRGVRTRSRALTLRLDGGTATLVSALTHPLGVLSATQGSTQRLPNGGTFAGWGSQRYFTEHDAAGAVVFAGAFARGNDTYRAYRFPWDGRPVTPPTLTATRARDRVHARMSWNGATGVAGWELWAGPSPTALARVKGAPRAGFETAISALTGEPYVAVKALDAAGAVLGVSAPLQPAKNMSAR
ncbi:MAG TPA: arylsulfotransferase family protein [Solirubrobacter sp.]|nr:arylsulfotransferase family protein [Solirubrobacter sp.]